MAFTMEFGTGFEMGQMPVRAGVIDKGQYSAINAVTVHTGTYSLSIRGDTAAQGLGFIRQTPGTEFYLSVWVYPLPKSYLLIQFRVGATVIADLRRSDLVHWNAYVNGVEVATGSVGTSDNTWQHIQIHFKCADAGLFETVIDGVPDIAYSGDTKPAALDAIDRIQFGTSYSSYVPFIDDFAIGTGGWPGDIRFDPVLISGDSSKGWSRSAGLDNYALVDEVPPSSTDYVYATSDVSDRYTTPGTWDDTDGLGNVVKDPVAVTVWADARKQSGNSDDKLQLTQGDGVNEVNNGGESLLTSYENRWFIRETAPDGGGWTKADVNALIVGIDADMA